jgi:hypothetical protein
MEISEDAVEASKNRFVLNLANGSAAWVSRMAAELGLTASLMPRGRPRKEIES